ncbi:uncharacterized protein LOC107040376 [Diachasma alloeum]|uniref:uncharacterized protein LOC107040376 n=1 Tax=Diachasma alloeum TaxID=454923 RepID=UPI000738312F|nr:uncharacterized protein LOC107040376 [Diachasma alloeum]
MVHRILRRIVLSNISNCGPKFVGVLAPLVVPPLHILFLYYFWREYSRDVDKQYCSCSCWDTVFKGSYESGVASYKHMYFNATPNSLKIWATIVIGVVAFYETAKYLAWLAFQRRLRLGMLVLFISAIFSHYYSWWVYINYWNDDFYSQWYHQMFFSITELISTVLVVLLADSKSPVTGKKSVVISGIGMVHIFAGSWDQFVTNVLRGEGYAHQVIRDLGFMIPDILHVLIPLFSLRWHNDELLPGAGLKIRKIKREVTCMIGLILVGLGMCAVL